MQIQVKNIVKSFNNFRALENVSLDIASGELVALLGPSGCGKTTLLRLIAGLECADNGAVFFDGKDCDSLATRERPVGFVFQHYALFKHMTIFENVAFGLRVRKKSLRPSKAQIRERVMELLSLVQLANFESRYPHELSGGQRQRVALARALAVEPKVLLLDEPFGALDAQVRKELRRWLRKLHDEMHITSLFVTHDQEEALEVADRIVVMNKGKIEQAGTPDAVYRQPKTPFVLQFMGNFNFFHARTDEAKDAIYVRPHEIEIVTIQRFATDFEAVIQSMQPLGGNTRITLDDKKTRQLVEVEISYLSAQNLELKLGMTVYYRVRNGQSFAYDFII